MRHHAFPDGLTPETLVAWYRATRDRTRALFEIPTPDAYFERPIPLRNPLVFYEGHIPAFGVNTLLKLATRKRGIDSRLELIFERGIDPATPADVAAPPHAWPSRERVLEYAAECDTAIEGALRNVDVDDDALPAIQREAIFTIIEHELMHQETLAYLLHQLPHEMKRRTALGAQVKTQRAPVIRSDVSVSIPAGVATLGARHGSAFGWDNEFGEHVVSVPAFAIDLHNVTNGEYLEYIEATRADPPHFWRRGEREWYLRRMFDLIPLPLDAPVYVTHVEAVAYARWKGKRLPTEAEFHRAAYGTPSGDESLQPWGDVPPDSSRGNFDFATWDPLPVGSFPAGRSAWDVYDLVGNGWEWTMSLFDAFPGFEPMASYRSYSTDFFDQAHYVMKGASPVTPRELVRRSFRNWFRPNYPYAYATFRCAHG